METPDLIEIKTGTVDYVGEGTCRAKSHANPPEGGFSANAWNIRKHFYLRYIPIFKNTPKGQTPGPIFARDNSNDAVSRKDVPFGD